jgi:hypothetical protein
MRTVEFAVPDAEAEAEEDLVLVELDSTARISLTQ